ncbi:MAG TPA: ABC transporter ATP-binding protein, partial [Gaiellaceae bacterium]|nr:ABC transporter ATP-binding protein [Gaiellaceae bacterium]
VQAFGREDDVRSRFLGRAEAVRHETMRQASIEARFLPGVLFLPTLGIAGVLFFGGREVIAGNLTIGEFSLFITLLLQLVWPLEALGWIINLGQRAVASAGRSFAWLEGVQPLPAAAKPRPLPTGPLPVRFEAVRFGYGTGAEVLRGVDLHVDAGEIVAVCGPTGAGKTTLLNLLPRFYDPTHGRVLLGGVDTREAVLDELRRSVAIVTQKPVLFSVPLRDNLVSARPDAPWDEVLVATQRLSTIGVADRAVVLQDGVVVEQGRPADLLAAGGPFTRLFGDEPVAA